MHSQRPQKTGSDEERCIEQELSLIHISWAATGIDQAIPADIPLRQSDLDADESWLDIAGPRPLTDDDLTFDVLRAGVARAGGVPVVVINEPIFISDGANSDVRYNSFYPRWAYDLSLIHIYNSCARYAGYG